MAVDAVMSMVGTGLGDAVVEVVYRVVLAHAGHIGADWHVGSFEQSSVGIPHVVGGAMVVDAVMSMVVNGVCVCVCVCVPRRGGGMCNDTARDAFRGPEIKLLMPCVT